MSAIEIIEVPNSGRPSEFFRGGAVSLGKFDGVHLGHVAILKRLRAVADQHGLPAIAITFDPPPITILKPELVQTALCTLERKIELISELGLDAILVLKTGREFLQLTPTEFFKTVLQEKLDVRFLVEGSNFTFGNNREGTSQTLRNLCEGTNVSCDIFEPVIIQGNPVSSSRIRELLIEGNVEAAANLLTKPYRIRGTVAHGEHRGRTLGFPTANLEGTQTLLPKSGVYACVCEVNGLKYAAATHFGDNPTFGQPKRKIEVHIIDFEWDIYGETIDVDIIEKLRNISKFESAEQLVAQMHADVDRTRRIILKPDAKPRPRWTADV